MGNTRVCLDLVSLDNIDLKIFYENNIVQYKIYCTDNYIFCVIMIWIDLLWNII
jgi:hypothetical protein